MIGFSDITEIHYFLNNYISWKSVHGIVAAYNKYIYNGGEHERIRITLIRFLKLSKRCLI
ncbi:MAG: hypothetical protein G5701_09155 [Serratia symbiotica]|nr:hypothetical protein [Serratia symbiotica]